MKILIAPDKFKGSLSAQKVSEAIKEGFLHSGKELDYKIIPMADGGEGTAAMLAEYTGGKMIQVEVKDPFFRSIQASYGISGDGKTAFVEMASASGLQLLSPGERNARRGATFGTGQLIRSALDHGVSQVVLGVGGSGTNDGGIGMGEALGARFFDLAGNQLKPVGESLIHIKSVNLENLDPRLKSVTFTAICDVDNPLTGLQGAAHVFGPQKGATSDDVEFLDKGLKNFARVVNSQLGIDINFPGAGAGGGLGGGARIFFDVRFQPGMRFISDFIHLDEAVKAADLIITGEGKIDEQTLSGKVVKGIADVCKAFNKPLVVVVGKNELSPEKLGLLGIKKVVALMDGKTSEAEAFENTYKLVEKRVKEEVAPFFL